MQVENAQSSLNDDNANIDKAKAAGEVLQNICHSLAQSSGWWTNLETGEDTTSTYAPGIKTKRNIGELLCLVHSEISEAMEGARKGLMDDKLPHRSMLEVELADAAIRIFDMAGGLGLDIGGAISEKLLFNKSRADHSIKSRKSQGGKVF